MEICIKYVHLKEGLIANLGTWQISEAEFSDNFYLFMYSCLSIFVEICQNLLRKYRPGQNYLLPPPKYAYEVELELFIQKFKSYKKRIPF